MVIEEKRNRQLFDQMADDASSLTLLSDSDSLVNGLTKTGATSNLSINSALDAEPQQHKANKSTWRSLMRRPGSRDSSIRSQTQERRARGDQTTAHPLGPAEGKARSKQSTAIDRKLEEDFRKLRREVEILVMSSDNGGGDLIRAIRLMSPELSRGLEPDCSPSEIEKKSLFRNNGVEEFRTPMGQLSLHFTNIQGPGGQREKWIHSFENITSIIFVLDLATYDEVLLEDSTQNRMMESLMLFESVVNSRWLRRTSIILFLDNLATFKEKLGRSPLSNQFPDYSGGDDVDRAVKYLSWRFSQGNRAHLSLYPHIIEMSNPATLRLVFEAVKESILQKAINDRFGDQ